MRYSLLIFSLLVSTFCYAQMPIDEKSYADSLFQQANSSSAEQRAKAHFELSYFYFVQSDSINALKQYGIAKKLSGNNQLLQDMGIYYLANLYYDYDHEKALMLYKKADSALKRYNNREIFYLRSKAWSNVAKLMQQNDDENGYIETLTKKAMPLAKKAHNSARIGAIYLDIGLGLYNTLQFKKSNEYLYKAANTVKNIEPVLQVLPDAYLAIAHNYLMLEEYNNVRQPLANAYDVLKNFPYSDVMADYYHMRGTYLYKVKDYKNSLISLDKAIEVAKNNKNYYLAESIYNRKFNLYFNQKKYKNALHVLNESSRMLQVNKFLRNRMGAIYNYSRVYGAMGQYKNAYDSLSKFIDIYDSLENANMFSKTRMLEAKFNVAEKERKIAALEAEKKETTLKQKNVELTNWLLLAVSGILFISFLLLYINHRSRKKLAMQKEVNYKQQLKEMEQQQQLASAEAMLEGEERERSRMARDLHDGLGGLLAGIKIKLSGHAKAENSTREDLEKVIEQLDESVSELRRIARNMMPESLVRFGLETSLRDLCESLSSANTRADFQAINIQEDIELSTQIVIYRIIQEALSNAIRHANAKNILLQCSKNEHTFFITIEDDGKGFNANEMQNKKGIGLSNIENRVKYLKGKLDIVSQPNEGTTINIEVNVAA